MFFTGLAAIAAGPAFAVPPQMVTGEGLEAVVVTLEAGEVKLLEDASVVGSFTTPDADGHTTVTLSELGDPVSFNYAGEPMTVAYDGSGDLRTFQTVEAGRVDAHLMRITQCLFALAGLFIFWLLRASWARRSTSL